jgi:hypothetical protein
LQFIDSIIFFSQNLLEVIPPVVMAAAITVSGVLLGLWRTAANAKHQREYELRRDHLLAMAGHAAIPNGMFGKISNLEISLSTLEAKVIPAAKDLSKSSCVAGLATMEKAFLAAQVFVTAWFDLLKQRIPLDSLNERRKALTSVIESVRLQRHQHFTVTPIERDGQWLLDLRRLENDLERRQSELIAVDEKVQQSIFVLRASSQFAAQKYQAALLELQIAIRQELDVARSKVGAVHFNAIEYRKLAKSHSEMGASATAEFNGWLQDFVAKQNSA